ncbi:PsbP-related protein [Leptolyngbya sp. FACHB-17]|uniref:PsbP-related protein n=1 Tax=unclassified Leptolyngbya TaxID=2650499 RepID=UPI001680D340|nr:PsbP-related protein [Leptolyngbya sp. FACHB-17]MBD2078449.1 hypothetical protein [Leptolyngbya sp. FACHB-17]
MKPFFLSLTIASTLLVPLSLHSSTLAESNSVSASTIKSSEKTFSTRRFSVRFPDRWIVGQGSGRVTLYNQQRPKRGGGGAPPFLIKTEIYIVPGRIDETSESSNRRATNRTVKVQKLTINGQAASRQWWDEGEFDFPNGVITYIPLKSNETAILASFYSPENRDAESAIVRLHNSFKLR